MAYNLLKGKKGIIFGALNDQSIAWKVAQRAVQEGAEIVLSNALSPCVWASSINWPKNAMPLLLPPMLPTAMILTTCSPKRRNILMVVLILFYTL